VIAAITPLSDKISRHTLKSGSLNGLLELVGRLRAQISRAMGEVVEVISCYEAGYDGFWLHRSLEERDVRNHVIDPANLQVNRRARGAKTDLIDAERLLRSFAGGAGVRHR
jgi:transposase